MENDQTQTERLRVLKMLEEGKLNAEECAELLAALDQPQVCTPRPKTGVQRGWAACGAVMVLIGFLLPWFVIAESWVDLHLSGSMFAHAGPGCNTGGEMPQGLGWLILVFALGAALIPNWKTGIFLLALGVAMLGFLMVTNMDQGWSVGLGLIIVALGYLIETTALLNERVWLKLAMKGV